ncbi:MAG TPA: hypothetical protein VN362_08110 [Xanthobacteraceae bacterium]|jgi:hypothetical protein|nr:hypothetical protein [Xanthobacteraceae bacterium]
MTIKLRPQLKLRTAVFIGCALLLAWLVMSRSLAAYLADVAPQAALRLNSRQPEALTNLADRMLNDTAGANGRVDATDQTPQKDAGIDTSGGAGNESANSALANRAFSAFDLISQKQSIDLPAVRAAAEAGLRNEPLNARALRLLGQVADAAKNDTDAVNFMQAAAKLSLRDNLADSWLMLKSFAAKNYQATVYYADILLRTTPELGTYVVPILARIAEDKGSAGLIKTALAGDPPWRDLFFQMLPTSITDARTPLDLLLALRANANPPSPEDINRYLNFLVQHKMYELAYYTWLQFLPAEELRNAGLLYNGGFEIAPSGSPFDWIMPQGSGFTVDIESRPDADSGHALLLNFQYGRVDYASVAQLIMLAPGRYHFTGRFKGELVGPRGLKWRIACAETRSDRLAEGPMINGRVPSWSDTGFDFTVPAQNCRAQYLSLDLDARMASESFVNGSVWFDDLQISRLASAPSQ